MQRSVKLAKEKSSSSWVTALLLKAHGFVLHKQAFRDALALHYGWTPKKFPLKCACGSLFTVDHALSCAKGGYPSIRHNEIRDLTANLLSKVCNNVCTKPELLPVTGENVSGASANSQPGARLDIAANGVWGGAHLNELTLMSGSSTLMPHRTDIQIHKQSTERMNSQKSEPTNNVFEKLNIYHLHRWFCLLLEV